MKKIPMDPPHYGVFQFSDTAPAYETALISRSRTKHTPARAGYAWPEPTKTVAFRPYRAVAKRVIDILFVLFTLPFSVPIIALCAVALWFEGGLPFYRQDRLGRKGVRFSILKLRTMVRDADQVLESHLAKNPEMRREWDELQKIRNDPRVTPVGHVLRITSLDELPQLWNVLIGDMSLVGPRPMLPEQLEIYGDAKQYNALRPGITGLWQVSARNNSRFNYRNEVDAAYERGLSLKLDLAILIKTIGVVLRPTGH